MTSIIIKIVAILVLLTVNGVIAMPRLLWFPRGGCDLNPSPIQATNARDT